MKDLCSKTERLNDYYESKSTDQDAGYVQKVFTDDESEKELNTLLSKQFYRLFLEEDGDWEKSDETLYRIHYNINVQRADKENSSTFRLLKWSYRIAGVILLLAASYFGYTGYLKQEKVLESSIEITSPAWARTQFTLPDGSTGWLNNRSSLSYSGNFLNDRQVYLNGEAFFDVTRYKNTQFTVNTDEIKINVTGTRFNVTSFSNDENIEVVLEEGKINISDKEEIQSLEVQPNDLVIFNKTEKYFTTSIVEPQKYLSWTEGKLIFRNDPIDIIAKRLERWYNVEVSLVGNFRSDLGFRGTFIDESLEEVLYFLKRSLPLDYKIETGTMGSDGTYNTKRVIITLL